MGFTGIAVSITLLVASGKPDIKLWAMILGIISLIMVGLAFYLSREVDCKEIEIKLHEIKISETTISELKSININIGKLLNEIKQERNERNNRDKK
jgi:hypothetical protein